MYPMTVTIHNEHQLSAILAALQPALGVSETSETSEINTTTNKQTKKEQAKATVATNGASSTSADASPLATAAAQQPAAGPAPTEPAAVSVSYEQVKVAIQKLAGAKGRDAVLSLLGEFGATNGPSLKPEQYADFVAKASA